MILVMNKVIIFLMSLRQSNEHQRYINIQSFWVSKLILAQSSSLLLKFASHLVRPFDID